MVSWMGRCPRFSSPFLPVSPPRFSPFLPPEGKGWVNAADLPGAKSQANKRTRENQPCAITPSWASLAISSLQPDVFKKKWFCFRCLLTAGFGVY
jgi:hypothetical protein